ncbi:MAG: sulfotransferase [Kordiimonadaceae bacterium]|nr:sulfotransferase [Kordiimonadaceae bacterium]MBO6569497.1 sulfotransferase [Kordiimonadaceae bacterium]MBO6964972.1 sulfotransferase [Kordiimonadaceae bacterium]
MPTIRAQKPVRKIFVGGYTKSGTTFIGRAFGLFNGVYARGELDYFRLFYDGMGKLVQGYNNNIAVVNKEVYDGFGSLEPVTIPSYRALHDKMFKHLFFAGKPVPKDCTTIVEKSPHNVYWYPKIRNLFPEALNLAVYRPPEHVFRSLMRHMTDHRHKNFADPNFEQRKQTLQGFAELWPKYIGVLEKNRPDLRVIQYNTAAKDNEALVHFLGEKILGGSPGLKAPIESLSKESYLKSLPEEARAKSLVQTGPHKIKLTDQEIRFLKKNCPAPKISFDF